MYNHNISMYDWEKSHNVVMKKIFIYDSLHSNVNVIYTATAIVDLCQDILTAFFCWRCNLCPAVISEPHAKWQ